jgi:hypothetical protein
MTIIKRGSPAIDLLQWERADFMFGVPIFFAIIFGYYRINLPADYPFPAAILVRWVSLQTTWLGFGICSKILQRVFPPSSRVAHWGILALGGVIGSVLMQPLRGLFLTAWSTHIVPANLGPAFPDFDNAVDLLIYHGGFTAVPVSLWLAAHAFARTAIDTPSMPHRVAPSSPAGEVPERTFTPVAISPKPGGKQQVTYDLPEFLRPTVSKIGADLIAFHSEDHYVRFESPRGSDLVRYRFKDAMRELRPLGFCQIHRTSAVNMAAIVDCNTSVHAASVRLKQGSQFPVSRSFRISLIEALAERRAS